MGKSLIPAKKKKVVEIDDKKGEELDDVPQQARYEHQLEDLKIQAAKAANQAAVPFYGCPKCRFARGGCIWWKCNPQKFAEHFAEFPEKYAGKKELAEMHELKMKIAELTQGEFEGSKL